MMKRTRLLLAFVLFLVGCVSSGFEPFALYNSEARRPHEGPINILAGPPKNVVYTEIGRVHSSGGITVDRNKIIDAMKKTAAASGADAIIFDSNKFGSEKRSFSAIAIRRIMVNSEMREDIGSVTPIVDTEAVRYLFAASKAAQDRKAYLDELIAEIEIRLKQIDDETGLSGLQKAYGSAVLRTARQVSQEEIAKIGAGQLLVQPTLDWGKLAVGDIGRLFDKSRADRDCASFKFKEVLEDGTVLVSAQRKYGKPLGIELCIKGLPASELSKGNDLELSQVFKVIGAKSFPYSNSANRYNVFILAPVSPDELEGVFARRNRLMTTSW